MDCVFVYTKSPRSTERPKQQRSGLIHENVGRDVRSFDANCVFGFIP